MKNSNTFKSLGICCPIFQPDRWDGKTHHWKEKHFIKSTFPALFYFPIPFLLNKGIKNLLAKASASDKMQPVREDELMLFTNPHPFKEEILFAVTGDVKNAKNITLSGTFHSNVFEGGFRDTGKFIQKMKAILKEKGLVSKQFYVHYAYCPKCSQEAETNFAVIFAKVDQQ